MGKNLGFLGKLDDKDVAGIPISGDVPSSSQPYLHVPCFLLNLQQRCLADIDPQRMFIVFRGWLKPTTSLCSICLKLEYHPHQLVVDIPSSARHIYHQPFHRIAFIPYHICQLTFTSFSNKVPHGTTNQLFLQVQFQ